MAYAYVAGQQLQPSPGKPPFRLSRTAAPPLRPDQRAAGPAPLVHWGGNRQRESGPWPRGRRSRVRTPARPSPGTPRATSPSTGGAWLRLVRKTVNQDDGSADHLCYGDARGSPGVDLRARSGTPCGSSARLLPTSPAAADMPSLNLGLLLGRDTGAEAAAPRASRLRPEQGVDFSSRESPLACWQAGDRLEPAGVFPPRDGADRDPQTLRRLPR